MPETEQPYWHALGEVTVNFYDMAVASASVRAACTCWGCSLQRAGTAAAQAASSSLQYAYGGFLAADQQRLLLADQQRIWRERQQAARAWQERTDLAQARLLAWMSDEQRQSYEQRRTFRVTGSDGSRWEIEAGGGQTGNVLLLGDDGQAVRAYCAHPASCPAAETYLAQALAIMTDVAGFRLVANVYEDYAHAAAIRSLIDALAPGPGRAA